MNFGFPVWEIRQQVIITKAEGQKEHFDIRLISLVLDIMILRILGDTVQKQLDTQLWKSVVYSGLKRNLGLILQEINNVLALNQIIAERQRRHVTLLWWRGTRKTQAILF